jgi:hypothetical protein
MYAAAGRTQAGGMVINNSDIPLTASQVSDWIIDQPSDDDIAFALTTWGGVAGSSSDPLERARILAKAIQDKLDPYRGIPSDWMQDAPPFDQYRRVIQGGDHVWCDNFAKIFVHAAISLGIPARIIEMPGRMVDPSSPLLVALADAHTTTEIFDPTRNRWIWVDLTFSILRAETAEQGLLDLVGLQRYVVDDSYARSKISFDTYDSSKQTVTSTVETQAQARGALMRFINRDQRYEYFAKKSSPPVE